MRKTVFLAALAACGSGSGSSSAPPAGGSPAVYVLEEIAGPHDAFGKIDGGVPARGAPFAAPGSGYLLTRISDVGDLTLESQGSEPFAGLPGRGMTNGYDRYAAVNRDNSLVLAFMTNDAIAVYSLPGAKFLKHLEIQRPNGDVHRIGETSVPRWNLSGQPGTLTALYATLALDAGTEVYRVDVATGQCELIHAFNAPPRSQDHSDMSVDARYRGFRLNSGISGVLDLTTKSPLPGTLPAGEVDISMTGTWAMIDMGDESTSRFYRITDLAAGITNQYVLAPTASHGHDGWAWDADGNEVWIFQDNTNDWFSAFDPVTQQRTDIFHMGAFGWDWGQHMSRMIAPATKGWFLMSMAEGTSGTTWYSDTLVMVEIRPAAEKPRLWRLGQMTSKYMFPTTGSDPKIERYFAEEFASISADGKTVWFGGNWYGTSNLELYRMELPATWMQDLAGK